MAASYVSKRSYQISSVDDIMKIPDMLTAREICKQWGIPMKGIKTKDEATKLLVNHWATQEKNEKVVQEEICNGMQEAIRDDQIKRQKLLTKYDEVIRFYHSLPKQHQADLQRFIPDLQQVAEAKKAELINPDCTILVTGETGAGKSSFINLLLETDLLPTSQLACTSTFCELRKNKDKKTATFYYKKTEGSQKKKSPKTINIDSKAGLEELTRGIKEFDETTEESPYDRIEIEYPFHILEEGMVIVDTPGFGENKAMLKHVRRYLERSFGFIYIVNSSNAGGVHEGRLKEVLRTVLNTCQDDFYPDTTMFVCNKWETVPDRYKEEVRTDTMRKLQKFFRTLTEDQLFFMSIDEAFKCMQTAGKHTPEHQYMLTGIQRLLPASLENKLDNHYRFLSQILKRAIYTLKVAKTMTHLDMKEKEELMQNIKTQMVKIQCNAMSCVDDLRRDMELQVKTLLETLLKLMKSPEFIQRVSYWNPRHCPGSSDTKKLMRDASSLIANRVAWEIDQWEQGNRVVKKLKENIITRFHRDFELMEDQMREIEGTLIAGEKSIISDLHKTMKGERKAKKIKQKKKDKQEDSVKTRTIGGAVSLSAKFENNKNVKSLLKTYKKKKPDVAMAEATQLFIGSIIEGKDLGKNISTFVSRFTKGIDMVARKIPDFISSDQELVQQIETQIKESQENLKDVPAKLRECNVLQGNLDIFFVQDLMRRDYRLRDLNWSESSRLGSGSFADVYGAKLKQGDHEIDVALKVFIDDIRPNTVTDILLEDRTLREMNHRNIIKYFGCTLQMRGTNKAHWIMILEFCDCNLKDKVLDRDFENPGTIDQVLQLRPMVLMARYASQTCQGLEYLHSKDLVHRDLKLENVLLTKDDVVKLTDVGLTKRETDIAGTLAGSPVYMAPEIHMQEGIYNRKADIFSLAIMLWEMWSGMDAAEHISEELSKRGVHPRDLGAELKKGLRPSMKFRYNPPTEWANLIHQCWNLDPGRRPEARHVRVFFEDFQRMNRR